MPRALGTTGMPAAGRPPTPSRQRRPGDAARDGAAAWHTTSGRGGAAAGNARPSAPTARHTLIRRPAAPLDCNPARAPAGQFGLRRDGEGARADGVDDGLVVGVEGDVGRRGPRGGGHGEGGAGLASRNGDGGWDRRHRGIAVEQRYHRTAGAVLTGGLAAAACQLLHTDAAWSGLIPCLAAFGYQISPSGGAPASGPRRRQGTTTRRPQPTLAL